MNKMTRRSFLSLSAMFPLSTLRSGRESVEHHFQYDHVMGTSLDLVVWTSSTDAAERVEAAVLDEIRRLSGILNTRDPGSEISRLEAGNARPSPELNHVFRAYDDWTRRTGGVISIQPHGPNTPRNVDAIGKAYIVDRAAVAGRAAAPGIDGLILNVGGDIVTSGRASEFGIADPHASHDNAKPIARIRLRDAAMATSGSYARGAHLLDGRTGKPAQLAAGTTVVAANLVTANALATALCLLGIDDGMALVARTPGAEAFRVGCDGTVVRTQRFPRLELPVVTAVATPANWPAGYELDISLTLTQGGGRFGGFGKRQYVAVWIENSAKKMVRILAFWAGKPRYYSELATFYGAVGRNQNLLYSTARATRAPGNYRLVWDGLDGQQAPVPPGIYRIVVETNQEHGNYAKQAGTIDCSDKPNGITLPATTNFEIVKIQYGPKSAQA